MNWLIFQGRFEDIGERASERILLGLPLVTRESFTVVLSDTDDVWGVGKTRKEAGADAFHWVVQEAKARTDVQAVLLFDLGHDRLDSLLQYRRRQLLQQVNADEPVKLLPAAPCSKEFYDVANSKGLFQGEFVLVDGIYKTKKEVEEETKKEVFEKLADNTIVLSDFQKLELHNKLDVLFVLLKK